MKVKLQIPLKHFQSDPQANGRADSSTSCPFAAVTQSDYQKAKVYSKSSSSSTSKPESSTTRQSAVETKSGRSMNSNSQRNKQESTSRSRCPPFPRRSPPRHRERTSTRPARSGRSHRGWGKVPPEVQQQQQQAQE